MQSRNIDDLRELLFDSMQDLRKGTINADQAQAISALAKRAIETAEAELKFLQLEAAAPFVPSSFAEKPRTRPALASLKPPRS